MKLKLKINEFHKISYEFALKYFKRHNNHAHVFDPFAGNGLFSFELSQKKYDNEYFDIDLDVFNWKHLMVAERYIEKNEKKYRSAVDRDSTVQIFYSELGNKNPFKRRRFSSSRLSSGGKTKRRGHHRRRA